MLINSYHLWRLHERVLAHTRWQRNAPETALLLAAFFAAASVLDAAAASGANADTPDSAATSAAPAAASWHAIWRVSLPQRHVAVTSSSHGPHSSV